ncbi:MAG: mannose-1-phosphate guanylyltransferase/mannose-6-phosphate isomerase [Pseudomonadota bacterium]
MTKVVPVVLAGGSGTRLWPLSRKLFPKQFHRLLGDESLLQNTLTRLDPMPHAAPIVICGEDMRFMVAEQCREAGIEWSGIILEPAARNTAPAIGLAASFALRNDPDAVLAVLPSDHAIMEADCFRRALSDATDAVAGGGLLTFGIRPEFPNTQFGYIEKSTDETRRGVFTVDAFHEKPDAERARGFVESGRHFWNSGMFVFRADAYLAELQKFEPEMHACVTESMAAGEADLDFFRPSKKFEDSPSQSIDYAVMERTDKALIMPVDFGWNDVGSWSALWDISDKDEGDNACIGDVLTEDTRESLLVSQSRLVAAVGVEGIVAIETPDAVLIASRDKVKEVGKLVKELGARGREEHITHTEVFRPWGSYESVEVGERYQVKRIRVKPGASLSLQMHYHRAEHWIVVTGTAVVHRDEEEHVLSENESIYIPLGATHRLTNPGKLPLELIEVQVGSYLGEDDIVRFEDVYGRSG